MQPVRLVLAGIVLLFLSSCFEPPVREDLRLRFLPNGAVVATSTVRIADPQESNPALARRLAETRRAILDGSDPWSARFAAAEAAAERFSWEKRLGSLRSATRSAAFAEPAGLEAFFRDTSVSVTYSIDPERGTAELAIVPGVSTRATRRQWEETEKTLEAWTTAIAEYLQAGESLYAYLADHPERSRACMGTLFAERLGEEEARRLEELTPEDEKHVARLDEAMRKVLEVLAVPAGEAYSPDEVSHLVYDPFPARLTVKTPGKPLEVTGFVPGDEGVLTVPSPGLWEALRSLEGRWLSPDPVLFYVESARQEGQEGKNEIDLDAFLKKSLQAAPVHLLPSAREVRSAVEGSLRPAPLYRVAWRVNPQDETEFRWEEGEAAP
ncbi:MAG TPA: hypothetical protein VKK31_10155 [Thermoanaerobaculia bacterium]|nr:hypothetical protein [Thermoanaerobaculia bacterium]